MRNVWVVTVLIFFAIGFQNCSQHQRQSVIVDAADSGQLKNNPQDNDAGKNSGSKDEKKEDKKKDKTDEENSGGNSAPDTTKTVAPGTHRIIIIRHGEKPDKGNNLSCQGFNRSLQLPNVLYKKFGVVDALYVPSLSQGDKTNQSRMYQTISPYAIKYDLKINTAYDVDDISGIAKAIKGEPGTVLIVWEHKAIKKIVQRLGIDDIGKWDPDDFDAILIIDYKNGVPVLTHDVEGLHPSADCP